MTDSEKENMPHSWEAIPLSGVGEISPGNALEAIDDDLNVSFVPMSAVSAGNGNIDVSAVRKLKDVKKGYTPFREGDVLFAKITPCMENGKMAVAPPLVNGLGFGSTEFHVIRPFTEISPSYVYYFISSEQFRRNAEHNMTGAVGQRRVPTKYFANQRIPLAPANEQKRIVTKIEELLSQLESGAESLRRAQKQLEVYRQALLDSAFAGKLTAQWRTDHKDRLERDILARAKALRDERYQQSAKTVAFRRKLKAFKPLEQKVLETLPQLPEGWIWDKLGWITCGVEYGSAAKSSKAGAVPVLRMGNIQGGKIDWSDLAFTSDKNEISKYALKEGDVLFNRTNSPELVGKAAIYHGERPAAFAGYLIRINQIPVAVDSQYLNLFLNSEVARQYGNGVKTDGVNQSNINGDKLVNYPFPYCSLFEQREIVKILDEKLSIVDRLEEDIELELRKASALRQAILNRAYSGKLVAQDPNDEPVAVMLARVRAEKPEKTKTPKQNAKKKNGGRKAA